MKWCSTEPPEAICGWSGRRGEVDVANNSRRVARGKILDLAFFSSQEALSLHFSFKLEVTINALLYRKFSHTEHKSYVCALTYVPCRSNSVCERDHTKAKRIITSQLWLRMVRSWPDQPDRFRRLCHVIFILLSGTA